MKVYVRTFGCQMNVHDSARIKEIMELAGYENAIDTTDVDVAIINTCSVREKAWHKAISEAGRWCKKKQKHPDLVVIVAGCVAQQEGETLFERIPLLDYVIGPDHYAQLPDLVLQARTERTPKAVLGFDRGLPTDFLASRPEVIAPAVTSFVTVMKGCEERCAYCIVPTVRGPERSRPSANIIEEVRQLVDRGVKEIMLLGQKVNSYCEGSLDFAQLLERLDAIPGLSRLRFTSPHPRFMSDTLTRCYGELETLCEAIHLPVQSGSNIVLQRMGRRYTVEFYMETVHRLRRACPDIMISTDLIVGYPGETETEFEHTIRLIEDVQFTGVFSFKYSPRPGTAAAELADDVPEEEKARRLKRVHEVTARVEQKIKENLIGTNHQVLVEGKGRKPGQLTGRARNNQIIHFVPDSSATLIPIPGQSVDVKVIGVLPHCLEGSLM